jgi:TM2 domain-containing membrane protein YozV
MASVTQVLPELSGNEMTFVSGLLKDMNDNQANNFAISYRNQRKDPTMILITTLLFILGFGGINKFLTGQIGLGILYFLTWGLCGIGSIIDLINYQKNAFSYNSSIAQQIAVMAKASA